jgi:Tfp pilus assembly protein PilP
MNKQRFITLIAILSFAQLAIIASRQLNDKNSDLERLRAQAQSFISSTSKLLSNNTSRTATSPMPNNSETTTPSILRPRELAPTFLKDDSSALEAAPKLSASLSGKPSELSARKNISSRDPFVPFFAIRNNNQGDPAYPLTHYSLQDLRVTAIIGDSSGNRSASIEAHDGKSFIVRVGARVGDSGGRVERITPSAIVIVEPRDSSIENLKATTKELSLKSYETPHSGVAD